MKGIHCLRIIAAGCATLLALASCGGGSDTPNVSKLSSGGGALAQASTAPALTNDIALDGRNWINFRRSQIGMPELSHNPTIDIVAQGHSEYQRINNLVTHTQSPGKQGFTGAELIDRLTSAGYVFKKTNSYAYGEVISATGNQSGQFMAEELVTAIYHRFVIFEPAFKEIGTGAAATAAGYAYFTANFTSNDGYGPGIGDGNIATWPFNGQTQVAPNFFSDYESPDPVDNINEVGYPISVHANINATVAVQSFSVRPRGGAILQAKQLGRPADLRTPRSAAAIVPLAPLKGGTTYDVSFSGTLDGAPISKNWSFTTK